MSKDTDMPPLDPAMVESMTWPQRSEFEWPQHELGYSDPLAGIEGTGHRIKEYTTHHNFTARVNSDHNIKLPKSVPELAYYVWIRAIEKGDKIAAAWRHDGYVCWAPSAAGPWYNSDVQTQYVPADPVVTIETSDGRTWQKYYNARDVT